ncbi:phosphohydrolase [Virgibacillus soli]|uniref:bis(5'-nucleosyl)-tetraphosphatase (symmetrical) YqeK n=1 Tax=Lederbergia galactosidilytica TaxID=217031 RepID=UPI000714FA3E|nr:bis(5'-nucleosyl)-tetraphosphatase (symmetrical) YqeK [Lederbergia galactosidilytica]KRG15521.1 phosphohydrolase [Virgibacillus soli]MBP1914849.1 putative HD superfamily hydrolase involved in NAD metabolism [Lederbergia galactosidilytica]
MNREQALEFLQRSLGTGPRYQHSVRVLETAIILAHKYGEDVTKVELAAIFHDYAKLMPIHELKKLLLKAKEDSRLVEYHSELWHGPVAAYLAHREFAVEDKDVLNAIRYHTTGRANMSRLEKIIFLADYIEPQRDFPGIIETRELAEVNLDEAVLKALSNTIAFLLTKRSAIYPDTFAAYNDLIRNTKRLDNQEKDRKS